MMTNVFQKFFENQGIEMNTENEVIENLNLEETVKSEQKVTGKIIKVSENGWGFISSKEIKFTRIFFHWTSLKQNTLNFTELKNGMEVEFTPVEVKDKGTRAIRIEVINNEPNKG